MSQQIAKTILMEKHEITDAVEAISASIVQEFKSPADLIVLGIRTRGAVLAERIRALLSEKFQTEVLGGILDITLYRDDLSTLGPQPMVRDSEINFDLTGAQIILVDDVLFTGRTIRAAMDEIVDFGRPAMIRLAVLIDRGCHEYPIRADYVGKAVETTADQRVLVQLDEIDTQECVILATNTKQ
ncbi:MAG: bifunctional pyr operon transcriptional regulator/uracil phosphoribosyltransferase PyrR [Sumerlaeia bacterium]